MSITLSEIRLIAASTRSPVRLPKGSLRTQLLVWRRSRQFLRGLETATIADSDVPYRKHLKDEAKRRRALGELESQNSKEAKESRAKKWELTVGIEVHAQLNTERKLFSRTGSPFRITPNLTDFDPRSKGISPIS